MNLHEEHFALLKLAVVRLQAGFTDLPEIDHVLPSELMKQVLTATADRLQDNYPYHHPLYLGQMLKPPHPIAQLAYTLAMCVNPNNHALDGGRASSAMELECIARLAEMLGWPEHLGHLCGGGTMGNFEALWVAREITGGKAVAVSSQAHYTHTRLSNVLQVTCHSLPVDVMGRIDIEHLEELLQREEIGTVIATLGTTGLGAVDPLHRLVSLRERYGFRLHVDAAYGGYFRLAENLRPETAQAFAALEHADSVVIDPHKHGLQPYGCGCVLFRDRRAAAIYHHESPYTYFTSDDLHLGEISLECSRPGAAAVALWATMQALPLVAGGEFAQGLEKSRTAALQLHAWLTTHDHFVPFTLPELDIVVWAVKAETTSQSNACAQRLFDSAAEQQVHLALLTLSRELAEPVGAVTEWDQPTLKCVRATVMKPEHLNWMPTILTRLQLACDRTFS